MSKLVSLIKRDKLMSVIAFILLLNFIISFFVPFKVSLSFSILTMVLLLFKVRLITKAHKKSIEDLREFYKGEQWEAEEIEQHIKLLHNNLRSFSLYFPPIISIIFFVLLMFLEL